jgi:hypothetical protein
LQPCPNKEEKYVIPVIINTDSSISFIKYSDSANIADNKCAYDFGRKIIPYLKDWMPAKVNGQLVRAIAEIPINPFYLYYSKDNPKNDEFKDPKFKKGIEVFSNQVKEIFQSKIKANENKRTTITFIVTENGLMEDFKIEGDITESEKKQIISRLSKIKGEWTPATFNGVPHKSRIRQRVTQEFDFKFEDEKWDRFKK